MKRTPENKAPADAKARKDVKPVICYPVDTLPMPDMSLYSAARNTMKLSGQEYHRCCHSNLTRALADETGLTLDLAETHVHDVLNVFMCTGFTHDAHQYFMKASPVRPGDFLEFFAEIDLLGALSACPGGDCSSEHSSDTAACFPLKVEIHQVDPGILADWSPPEPSTYSRSHWK